MCGRYSLFDEQDNAEIRQIIAEVKRKYPDQPIRTGEIFPTNTVPVLTADGASLTPNSLVWGFPKYTGSGMIINARAETAEEKKTFRGACLRTDVLYPAQAFTDGQKRKYLFRLPGEQTWRDSVRSMTGYSDM